METLDERLQQYPDTWTVVQAARERARGPRGSCLRAQNEYHDAIFVLRSQYRLLGLPLLWLESDRLFASARLLALEVDLQRVSADEADARIQAMRQQMVSEFEAIRRARAAIEAEAWSRVDLPVNRTIQCQTSMVLGTAYTTCR